MVGLAIPTTILSHNFWEIAFTLCLLRVEIQHTPEAIVKTALGVSNALLVLVRCARCTAAKYTLDTADHFSGAVL